MQLCCDCKLYTNQKQTFSWFALSLINEIEINNQLRNMDTKVVFHVTSVSGLQKESFFVINILIFI